MRRTTRPHCMHNGFGQILAVQLEVHPKKKLREPSFSSNFLSDFFGGGGGGCFSNVALPCFFLGGQPCD